MKPAALLSGAMAVLLAVLVGVVAMGTFLMGASQAACGPGNSVPTSADLDPGMVGAINVLKAIYEQVASEKDLSWAALAGVDYREDGNDPNASALSGEPLGTTNPDNPSVITTTKLDSLQQAADHLKAMASSVYGVTLTAASGGDDVKNAFLAYNRGYIYQRVSAPADSSPYVMNQYDEAHHDMTFPAVAGEPLAGMVDLRPGAFTVFSRLGGASTSACGALSGNHIVAVAQQQLGLAEVPKGCNCGPEIQKFLGSSPSEFWCADFVSWTYKEAGSPFTGGLDGGWRFPAAEGLRGWLMANGDWHARATGDGPQPGDVVIFAGDDHAGIVERTDGSTLDTIEGNSSDQVIRRSYENYDADGDIVGWGRQRAPGPAAQAPAAPSGLMAVPV